MANHDDLMIEVPAAEFRRKGEITIQCRQEQGWKITAGTAMLLELALYIEEDLNGSAVEITLGNDELAVGADTQGHFSYIDRSNGWSSSAQRAVAYGKWMRARLVFGFNEISQRGDTKLFGSYIAASFDNDRFNPSQFNDREGLYFDKTNPQLNLESIRIGSSAGLDSFVWLAADIRLWSLRNAESLSTTWRHPTERLTGREPELVGYWKIDEMQGDTLHDATRAGNHAKLSGNVSWCKESGYRLLDTTKARGDLVRRRRDRRSQADSNNATDREIAYVHTAIAATDDALQRDATATAARIASINNQVLAIKQEFKAWKASLGTQSTTLKRFVASVTGEMDKAVKCLDLRHRPYRLQGATLDARWLAIEEPPRPGRIEAVSADEPVVVTTADAHGLGANDRVWISGVQGMERLNNRRYRVVLLTDKRFALRHLAGGNVDGHQLGTYAGGGTWERRDRFLIRFPQLAEPLGEDISRLSRFRFDFTPVAPPEAPPGESPVPDVLRYTEALARRKLQTAGFRVEVLDVAVEETSEAGLVIGQRPHGGEHKTAPPNSLVTLFLGRTSGRLRGGT